MLIVILWILSVLILRCWASTNCIDIHSQVISQGLHYVPGPNTCILCICDQGSPKWCKSVLCSPPQNCKSFQVGNSCCDFKCLDDILTNNDSYKNTYDLALRLVASAFTALLSLSILFLLYHRLRRRKIRLRQQRQANEDQRSLNSIGYITGSLDYHSGNYGYLGSGSNELEFPYEESSTHFSLWKPPGNYFPRGEAPPPYEEVIRIAQLETDNTPQASAQSHTTVITAEINTQPYSISVAQPTVNHYQNESCVLLTRNENASNASNDNHTQYVNLPFASSSSQASSINFAQASSSRSNRRPASQSKASNAEGKEKSKSYDNIFDRNRNLAMCSESRNNSHISSNQISETSTSKSNRVEYENVAKNHNGDMNKKYKMTKDSRHRTISKGILVKNKTPVIKEYDMDSIITDHQRPTTISRISKGVSSHRTLPSNFKDINLSLSVCLDQVANNHDNYNFSSKKDSDINSKVLTKTSYSTLCKPSGSKPASSEASDIIESMPGSSKMVPNHAALQNVSRNSASKTEGYTSYQCLTASVDDDEDYRSECENCKFVAVTNAEETDILNETMTLQRRPLDLGEEPPYYRTSLTLPTNTKKSSRILNPKPDRESWFLTMDEYSSSDDST